MRKRNTTKRVVSSNFGCHRSRVSRFNEGLPMIDLTVENFIEYWLSMRSSYGTISPYRLGCQMLSYCHKASTYTSLIGKMREEEGWKKVTIHDAYTAAFALYAEGYRTGLKRKSLTRYHQRFCMRCSILIPSDATWLCPMKIRQKSPLRKRLKNWRN